MKYYSEILNKNFDTEKELVEAEEDHKAEQAKKEEAKALVKKESTEVEEAFKARNAARHAYNEKLIELKKAYNETVKQAEKEFTNGLKDVTEAKDKAENEYSTKLSAFQKAHPEGYHITLKDGDNVVTYTSNPTEYQVRSTIDDDLLDLFSNFLMRW